jgi:hypothetical protein
MAENEKPKVLVLHRYHGKLMPDMQPIVLEYKERRKKGKVVEEEDEERYSDGLEDLQRMERDVMRVAKRSARAVTKGLDTYDQESRRSAKEKKDGAIEDFANNSAKAASVAMKEAAEIPMDIAESMNRRSYRKRLRNNLRRMSRVIRLFRM